MDRGRFHEKPTFSMYFVRMLGSRHPLNRGFCRKSSCFSASPRGVVVITAHRYGSWPLPLKIIVFKLFVRILGSRHPLTHDFCRKSSCFSASPRGVVVITARRDGSGPLPLKTNVFNLFCENIGIPPSLNPRPLSEIFLFFGFP